MRATADKNTTLTLGGGVHSMVILKGKEVDIPERFQKVAQANPELKFLDSPNPNGRVDIKDECENKVALVAEAMKQILEEDDPVLLESSGIPRTSEIKKLVGGRLTKKVLEEAWAIVEG